jgi:hypothetical protein
MTNIKILHIADGAVWKSLFLHGDIPLCADSRGVEMEIRLFNQEKRIEFLYGMHKFAVTTPEAVYVAFPFYLNESKIFFEAQGGMVSPGVNQLEGTASDWNTIQNFAAVRNNNSQIVFGSNDIPLVQFGAINTGKYYYKHIPESSHIYSWVLNNYWTTNFKAAQEGEMKWKYYISSSDDNSNGFATRFAWAQRIPLLTRVLPAGKESLEKRSQSLLDIDLSNVILINAKPSDDVLGLVLHLRETNGENAIIDVDKLLKLNDYANVLEVNVLEEEIAKLKKSIKLEPFETKFLKLKK